MNAAATYAARVDAVVAQRTRLRGPQPPGDLFADLPPDHILLVSDPRRELDPNLAAIAAYVEPEDVVVDVGGGAGRLDLPLALRCREVINVDPSAAMGAAFEATARREDIANARFVHGAWPIADPPVGDVVLVNHVTYLTRDIVPFVTALEAAARRRVLITVNDPPPPYWHRDLYRLIHGEAEEVVPGHVELVNALWELGILPDVRVLSRTAAPQVPTTPNREAAVQAAVTRFPGDQWALWPLGPELEARARRVVEEHFDALFAETEEGLVPRWITPGREILITWEVGRRAA
jgi:SAM-dependent methyltransferase